MIARHGRILLAGFFGVLVDVFDDAFEERVLEPLFDRCVAPGLLGFGGGTALPFHRFGKFDEPLGRIRPAIEQHVFDKLLELRLDLFVDGELAGVDDAHVEPGLDRVIQERGVHRFADDVVAAERERDVRDAAGDVRAGAGLFDLARSPR